MSGKPKDGAARVTLADWHARMQAMRPTVGKIENIAFKCPICGTVQSMASLVAAGVPPEKAEGYIGFSCEGRFTDAGPWRRDRKPAVRGCDWTLGGLFRLHKVEVVKPDGTVHPTFDLASTEESAALMQTLESDRALIAAEETK